MVLAINGQPVSSYNDVEGIVAEVAAAAAGQPDGGAPPAKRARLLEGRNAGAGAAADGAHDEEAPVEAQQGQALPQVQLTIFRDGAIRDVAVRWAAPPVLLPLLPPLLFP